MEGYQKAINAPSLMSSLRNTDPHCLRKYDAWLDADSALQTAATPCNHKTLCTDLNPKSHRTEGGEGKGGLVQGRGGIEFIIQKPDYDGGSGEKTAVGEPEVGELAHKGLKIWL